MLPLKKILCPTDFSDPSLEAMKVANELATHFSAELLVLHVITPVPVMTNEPMMQVPVNLVEYQQQLESVSQQQLQKHIKKLVSKKVKTHSHVVVGHAADEIVRLADEEKVDLIVISTRGQTGLKRLVFGSVAEKVVRIASQPVLTIRHE